MTATVDFVPVWTVILAAGIFFYVLLDGFDLGVGILFGLAPDTKTRNIMMSAIAPVWDGNETWLVLGGLGLLTAFPLAFAIIIPALYFPILVMLLALVFRGVAFEFRTNDREERGFWDHGFAWGSTIASFAQGTILAAFIQGFQVNGRVFSGGAFDFLTPFSVLTGIGLVFGYGLLGAGWLVLKTEGETQDRARRQGSVCLVGALLVIALISIWTPSINPQVAERWFSVPNLFFLLPVPLATLAIAIGIWRALGGKSQSGPFIGAVGLFVLSYLGIAVSLFPMIVPGHYTLWQAASPPTTQAFLLLGALFLIPIILFYSGWSYWVFRGKVRSDIEYH